MARRKHRKATFGNVAAEIASQPARKYRIYMLTMIGSAVLTLGILSAFNRHPSERTVQSEMEDSIEPSLFITMQPQESSDTGLPALTESGIVIDRSTDGWPMEGYGVEVPMDCHIPPDFTQPELQEACVRWRVPASECEQFLLFSWKTSADYVHPALGLRPGCQD